jgi:hypothetical protein
MSQVNTIGKVLRPNARGTVWRAHLAAVLLQQRNDLHVVPPHSILQVHFLVDVGCKSDDMGAVSDRGCRSEYMGAAA